MHDRRSKAFFDTNVLLYMYGGDPAKQLRALDLFGQYARDGRLVLSTQVVQEFYAAGSRKLGMSHRQAREAAAALLDFPLIVVSPSQIVSAFRAEEQYQISFWDAHCGGRRIERRRGPVNRRSERRSALRIGRGP